MDDDASVCLTRAKLGKSGGGRNEVRKHLVGRVVQQGKQTTLGSSPSILASKTVESGQIAPGLEIAHLLQLGDHELERVAGDLSTELEMGDDLLVEFSWQPIANLAQTDDQ
jgi:hypothetical protein